VAEEAAVACATGELELAEEAEKSEESEALRS